MAKNTPIILVAGMSGKIIQNRDICLMPAMSFPCCKCVIGAEPDSELKREIKAMAVSCAFIFVVHV